MGTKITINSIPVSILRERKSFVAYSPALDLTTCGRTLEEARANFKEAVEIFFEECISMGTLDRVLCSLGWEKTRGKKKWLPPITVAEESVKIPAYAFS